MNCPSCGTEIPLSERFCRNCGYDTMSPSPPADPGMPTLRGAPFQTPTMRDAAAETARMWAAPSTGPISAPLNMPPTTAARRSPLFIPALVGSIILVLSAVGVLAYFLLLRDNGAGTSGEVAGP